MRQFKKQCEWLRRNDGGQVAAHSSTAIIMSKRWEKLHNQKKLSRAGCCNSYPLHCHDKVLAKNNLRNEGFISSRVQFIMAGQLRCWQLLSPVPPACMRQLVPLHPQSGREMRWTLLLSRLSLYHSRSPAQRRLPATSGWVFKPQLTNTETP